MFHCSLKLKMEVHVLLHLIWEQKVQCKLNGEDSHYQCLLPLEIPHIWICGAVEGKQYLMRKEKGLEEMCVSAFPQRHITTSPWLQWSLLNCWRTKSRMQVFSSLLPRVFNSGPERARIIFISEMKIKAQSKMLLDKKGGRDWMH